MNGNPLYVPNNDEIQKFQILCTKILESTAISKRHAYEVNNSTMKWRLILEVVNAVYAIIAY